MSRISEREYYDAYARLIDGVGKAFGEAYDRNAFNHLTRGGLTMSDPTTMPVSTTLDPTDPANHLVQPYASDELNNRLIEGSCTVDRLAATVLDLLTARDKSDKTIAAMATWINTQIEGAAPAKKAAK